MLQRSLSYIERLAVDYALAEETVTNREEKGVRSTHQHLLVCRTGSTGLKPGLDLFFAKLV